MSSEKEQMPRDPRIVVRHEYPSITKFVDEYINNVSRSGAFILTRSPLPVGTTIDLKFTIHDSGGPITIEGVGEVVRNQAEPSGMGVVFIMLTVTSLNALNSLLTRRLDPET
ncbi:MAG: PilZ domain-containing protein [Kofleriaceae bacterium]